MADLAINATIILRYGLDHYREMGGPITEGGGAVRSTLLRHLTAFEYRLVPEAAIRFRQSIDDIDKKEVGDSEVNDEQLAIASRKR